MRRILVYTFLLILGLICSQFLPLLSSPAITYSLKQITMVCLAFIMINVGLEFRINKQRLYEYEIDYLVAFISASFPWLFCSIYFVYAVPSHPEYSSYHLWSEALLIGRFAAPTSAGVLFTMLTAAGLARTWVFKKARVLAIFDDLDTIILLIPLKMLILGMKFELILIVIFLVILLIIAWKYLHQVPLPLKWYWVILYSTLIVSGIEIIYQVSKAIPNIIPLHLEVLLPAFVLGCIIAYPRAESEEAKELFAPIERTVHKSISAAFMFLVGLAMPPVLISPEAFLAVKELTLFETFVHLPQFLGYQGKMLSFNQIIWHTIAITILSNLGKMFPIFCYKKQASLKERVALAFGMCPRGEVGAGIIVVSLALLTDKESPLITIAMFSLAFNLILTGPIIYIIKKLLMNNSKEEIKDNETMV